MAVLTSTTVNGTLSASGGILNSGQDFTPWYRIYHCADAPDTNPAYAAGWIHVRTPLPAESSAFSYIPSLLEVKGFHTYSGEHTHYWKAVVNVTDTNVFQANVRVNAGNTTGGPRVYRSNNTYGSYRRVCFAMQKIGCCCVGWFWVRWRMNSSWFTNHPWATTGGGTLEGNYF